MINMISHKIFHKIFPISWPHRRISTAVTALLHVNWTWHLVDLCVHTHCRSVNWHQSICLRLLAPLTSTPGRSAIALS